MSAAAEISFDNVVKDFPRPGGGEIFRAVDGVTFSIARGDIVALLGKTGCGKSTLFNMIAGLTGPSAGTVRVRGRDPFGEFDALRGEIAIVFQNDRLLPWRSAIANAGLGLEMLGRGAAERKAAAQFWLTRLGLAGHEADYPHALSGGMRQRVSMARAFAAGAGILLCDEPFSALDEMTAQTLRGEFSSLVRENGRTAVFITHSISEALELGDRIIVLRRPARIALDIRLERGMDRARRDEIRENIQAVLAE